MASQTGTEIDDCALYGSGGSSVGRAMAFFTSLFVYLGVMGGTVVVLLMSLSAFLAGPNQPAIARQPVLIVAKPSAPAAITKATATSITMTTGLGRWGPRVVLGAANDGAGSQMKVEARPRKKAHLTSNALRVQRSRRIARQEVANRWGYQQETDFEYRRMGYGYGDPEIDRIR
jgi:hypothetical protein